MYKIGFDLGGTKIEGVILDDNNNQITRKRIPTGKSGYASVITDIYDFYNQLREEIGDKPHTVGLGTPGAISKKTGLLKNCPNIPGMNGKPFQKDLIEKLGRDITVLNDANCFALAEASIGAGKGKDMVFGVIMGTGCGGGLVYKGQAINGLQECAGEWGHSTINFNGPEDASGTKGSIEGYISGTGLKERYKEKYNEELAGELIVKAYREGDEKAGVIMDRFFDYFGIAISNLITILDPDVIVLGGGLSNVEEVYTEGIKRVSQYSYLENIETPILKNELGDSAGVLGAALCGV